MKMDLDVDLDGELISAFTDLCSAVVVYFRLLLSANYLFGCILLSG